MKFKKGDIIKAISDNYGKTSLFNEYIGEVISVGSRYLTAKTISSKDKNDIGKIWRDLNKEHFELRNKNIEKIIDNYENSYRKN